MMASLVDALLAADANTLRNDVCETMEIPRLSAALGVPFVITLKSISGKRLDEIDESSIQMTRKGRVQGADIGKMKSLTLVDGIQLEAGVMDALKKKLNAVTPAEVYQKLFTAGETQKIYKRIRALSGFDEEDDEEDKKEEIKN